MKHESEACPFSAENSPMAYQAFCTKSSSEDPYPSHLLAVLLPFQSNTHTHTHTHTHTCTLCSSLMELLDKSIHAPASPAACPCSSPCMGHLPLVPLLSYFCENFKLRHHSCLDSCSSLFYSSLQSGLIPLPEPL